jgi:hypothetical protein
VVPETTNGAVCWPLPPWCKLQQTHVRCVHGRCCYAHCSRGEQKRLNCGARAGQLCFSCGSQEVSRAFGFGVCPVAGRWNPRTVTLTPTLIGSLVTAPLSLPSPPLAHSPALVSRRGQTEQSISARPTHSLAAVAGAEEVQR